MLCEEFRGVSRAGKSVMDITSMVQVIGSNCRGQIGFQSGLHLASAYLHTLPHTNSTKIQILPILTPEAAHTDEGLIQ